LESDASIRSPSLFDRFRRIGNSVRRTRDAVFGQVADLFDRREVDDSLWEELEELLIRADVGVPTTEYIISETREQVRPDRIPEGSSSTPGRRQTRGRRTS